MKSSDYPNIKKFITDNHSCLGFDKTHDVINMMDDNNTSEKDFLITFENILPRLLESFKLKEHLAEKLRTSYLKIR